MQPSLMRTSQLTANSTNYNPYSGGNSKAKLELQSDLNLMAVGWYVSRVCWWSETDEMGVGTKRNGTPSEDWYNFGEDKTARSSTLLSDRSSRRNTSRTVSSSRASTERTRMNASSLLWTPSTYSRHSSACDSRSRRRTGFAGIWKGSVRSRCPRTSRAPRISSSSSCRFRIRNRGILKRMSRCFRGVSLGRL